MCGWDFCKSAKENGGGCRGGGVEGREDERSWTETEDGMRVTEERERRRRGDRALGTDRDMNNLSTLLMNRLGKKMKRGEAREGRGRK